MFGLTLSVGPAVYGILEGSDSTTGSWSWPSALDRSGKTRVELTRAFADTPDQLDAIYASQRLVLPYNSMLLSDY